MWPSLQLYWDGFWTLDDERSHATAVTPIPGSAIRAYCRDLEMDAEQAQAFVFIIKAMDRKHCDILMKKQELAANARANAPKK